MPRAVRVRRPAEQGAIPGGNRSDRIPLPRRLGIPARLALALLAEVADADAGAADALARLSRRLGQLALPLEARVYASLPTWRGRLEGRPGRRRGRAR